MDHDIRISQPQTEVLAQQVIIHPQNYFSQVANPGQQRGCKPGVKSAGTGPAVSFENSIFSPPAELSLATPAEPLMCEKEIRLAEACTAYAKQWFDANRDEIGEQLWEPAAGEDPKLDKPNFE